MSWDSYVDNLLAHTVDQTGSRHGDKAAIIGLDGSMWTSGEHAGALKLSASEAAALGTSFRNKDFSAFQANGIYLEGVKYQFLREMDGLVLAKKKDHGAVSIEASKTGIVIGHTKEGCQQGNVNKGVNAIADYLKSLNM